MLSHRHLRRMHAAGRDSLQTLHRHLACGANADAALRRQLWELAKAHDAIALLTPEQLVEHSIDWECAGMILSAAMWEALGYHAQTGDVEGARKLYSAAVGRLLKPRLPW